jgi:hypothetical protein
VEDGPQAPDQGQQRVYAPHDVAARLGISGAGQRRLSTSYERVQGPLPRDGRGRLWPAVAGGRREALGGRTYNAKLAHR